MRLSLGILSYELEKRLPATSHLRKKDKELPLPLLYQAGDEVQRGGLYITAAADLPEQACMFRDCVVICCQGDPPPAYNNVECDLLIVHQPCTLGELLNQTQAIFSHYQDIMEEFTKSAQQGASLQYFVNRGSLMLDNLITVTQEGFAVIAAAYEGDLITATPPRSRFKLVNVDSDLITRMHEYYVQHRQQRDVYLTDDEQVGYPTLNINLFDGDVIIGIASVNPINRDILPHDRQLLRLLAPFIQSALLREREQQGGVGALAEMFANMLAGRHIDKAVLMRLLDFAGFAMDDTYSCALVPLPGEVSREYGEFLRRRIITEFPCTVVFLHEKQLVALFNEDRLASWEKGVENILSSLLIGFKLKAGFSDVFNDLLRFRHYYMQAKAAMELGEAAADGGTLHRFADYRCAFALDRCCGELPAELLFPPGFVKLLEYDKGAAVSYEHTLRIYLDEKMNLTAAAKKLYISRNALIYRLERLNRILGEDLEDEQTRFYLMLCLRLREKHGRGTLRKQSRPDERSHADGLDAKRDRPGKLRH